MNSLKSSTCIIAALACLLPSRAFPFSVQAASVIRLFAPVVFQDLYVDCNSMAAVELGTQTQPFDTIQEAMSAASSFMNIYVAEGTYYENVELAPDVHLYGGYDPSDWSRDIDAHQTIIDGDKHDTVVEAYHLGVTDLLISGFTITNGSGRVGGVFANASSMVIEDCIIHDNEGVEGGGARGDSFNLAVRRCTIYDNTSGDRGRGVSFSGSSELEVSDCDIYSNSSTLDGGGIYCWNSSSVLLTGNNIMYNVAGSSGGGISCDMCERAEISGNQIYYNEASQGDGGGIELWADEAVVSDNWVGGNIAASDGGGMAVISDLALDGNAFLSNIAAGDGGGLHIYFQASSSFTNNIIAANYSGAEGGGLYACYWTGEVVNNTFADNVADRNGGGCMLGACAAGFVNTILWNNKAAGVANQVAHSGGVPIASYCDVQGGWRGTMLVGSMINADPLFVDSASLDYHLRLTSPCRDAGTSSGAPSTDYDGQSRPWGGRVDIGADEYRFTYVTASVMPVRDPDLSAFAAARIAADLAERPSLNLCDAARAKLNILSRATGLPALR